MNIYTEDQVRSLLKEQRRICETAAAWQKYPGIRMFQEGEMLKAPEPEFPKPYQPKVRVLEGQAA